MKKLSVLLLFAAVFCFIKPAEAIDPATMTASAPKALELAAIWSPHTISAMQSTGIGMVNIGKSALNILLLPVGILQCTLGMPLGMLDSGVDNFMTGICAPFELCYHVILLPVRIISLGTVR